jgi:hypothetical protein
MPRLRSRKVIRRILRALARLALGSALLLAAAILAFTLSSPPMRLQFQPTPEAARHPKRVEGVANYARDEVDTFYTYPEWYIVWSYQAKADFQKAHLPSGYSYFGDIGQFWQAYSRIYAATRAIYSFPTGDHIMLAVIGSSLTVEYTLKGLYEETIGRISEWSSGYEMVPEDDYAAKVAQDYAVFVHIRPFYEFSFRRALYGLWSSTPFRARHLMRSVERRAWLSLDYAVEAAYCEAIELATHATYGFEDVNTAAWITFPNDAKASVFGSMPVMKMAKDLGSGEAIVEIPRYQEFTADALKLIAKGAQFRQIAGNELMLISGTAAKNWINTPSHVQLILSQPLLVDRAKTRVVMLVRVPELHEVIPELEARGVVLEHLYDY